MSQTRKTPAKKPKVLTRTALEKTSRRKVEFVDLSDEGLDGGVYVRELSMIEVIEAVARYEDRVKMLRLEDKSDQLKAFVNTPPTIAIALCDRQGVAMYCPEDLDEGVEMVRGFSLDVMRKLDTTISRISNMDRSVAENSESLKETPGD